MSIDAEQLVVTVGADTTSADQTIGAFSTRAGEELATINNEVDNVGSGGGSGSGIDGFFNKFLTFQAVVQATRAVVGFAEGAVDAYAANERLGLSLDTLVAREERNADSTLSMADALAQAAPKAQELLHWNEELAVHSPFDEAGIASAFRTAEAFGFVSDSADTTAITAKRLTQDLVDFTAGSGQTTEVLNRITAALGKVQASGELSGREVRELTLAGVQVDAILGKAFNVTTAEAVKMREDGLIPADQAVKAIAYSLENDFGGAAQRQSGTISGLLNSLSDLETIGSRDLLGPAIKEVQPYLQQLVDTLNSQEGKATIAAIGQDLASIAHDDIPAIVSQGKEWLAGLQTIYGVIQPVVSAYHEMENIKIPGLGDLGNAVGDSPLVKLGTGGYLIDLANQYQNLTTSTAAQTAAQTAANAAYDTALDQGGDGAQAKAAYDATYANAMDQRIARTKDDIYVMGQATQAQSQLALSTQASTEDLKKYQDQLDKTGETGQAAYEKLQDSQQQFQGAEQQRQGDHQARLTAIDQQAQDQRATQKQNYQDADANRSASYMEQLRQYQQTFDRQETDTQAAEHDRQVQARTDEIDKLAGINEQARARTVQNIQADQARDADYQARQVDLATQNAEKLTDLQAREQDRQLAASQSYHDRATQLTQRATDLQTQYVQDAADRQQAAADQLADRQQQYAQRTADLQSSAADTQQTNDEQFQEDKQTRLGDHTDRLSDLTDQLNAATDAKQKVSIQKQLDAEDDRYAKQEAKAQTSYDRQSAKAAAALQKQLDQAAQAEARQEEQDAKAQQKQDDAAAKQLAKQQATLTAEQASQDKAYADSEAKASTAYARQIAAQDAATATQLTKLQDAHAKQVAADDAKYQSDIATLHKSYDAEIADYASSEAKNAQHLETQRQARSLALAQQVNDAGIAYGVSEAKAKESYDKQQTAADLARQKQITSENTSFARQEQTAQTSYDKQQTQLDTALGKQLLAYTDIQLKMSAISAQESQKREALIAAEFGVDPKAAQAQFATILAQLSRGGGVAVGPDERGPGGTATVHVAQVNIVLPQGTNVNDPTALANATQQALLQLQNRNGGTGLHP